MVQNIDELWQAALEKIETKISKPSFETWLKHTKAVSLNDDTLVINVLNEFAKDWLEGRYTKLIKEILLDITGSPINVQFILPETIEKEEKDEQIKQEEKPEVNESPASAKTMLNPKYTFDSFVIGAGNRFAHAASLAVAEAPANAYNPLFIYGGVGLGKTHLMHAIGHYIREHNPEAKVVYLSSE